MAKMSDTEAMNRIHLILDGDEWDSDTTQEIAMIVQDSGREIAEQGDHTREKLIELIKEDWLNSIASAGNATVDHILMEGHTGFNNMSYSELLLDAANAGLIEE